MMGIYGIRNTVNNKIYIGQSVDIDRRLYQHKKSLDSQTHRNRYLQRAWNKYGEENFIFYIVEEITDKNKLNDSESKYIEIHQSNMPIHGYNLTSGGDSYEISCDTKERISLSSRGKNSNLSTYDVRRIKMSTYLLMDREDISNHFGVSNKVVSSIVNGKSFAYVCEHLNDKIYNLKQKMIDDRNKHIVELYHASNTISEISHETGFSISVVEKAIYKLTDAVDDKRVEYQKIYDEVHMLYDSGMKKYHIAKKLKISPSTVGRYLSKKNNPYNDLPYKKISSNDEIVVINMYNNNTPIKEIANSFNVSNTTIEAILNKSKYQNKLIPR